LDDVHGLQSDKEITQFHEPRAEPGRKYVSQKLNAVEASHLDRIVRGFLLCFVTAWRRNDCLSPTALALSTEHECRICQSLLQVSDLAIINRNCCGGQGPILFASRKPLRGAALQERMSRDRGGGRNARATSRAHALFWSCPRRFTLENRRLPLALPQSFGKLRNATFFAVTHSPLLCCGPQYKSLLRLCRSCGGRDFPVEDRGKLRGNFFAMFCPPCNINNLDAV
jgi:hypothetical protein